MIRDIFLLQNPWRTDPGHEFKVKNRKLLGYLEAQLHNELMIGLLGSRQVGKSSLLFLLIKNLLKSGKQPDQIFYFNLDDFHLHEIFHNVSSFINFLGKNKTPKYIFIDEIQRLNNPGLFLKEIFDLKRNIKIFYSGSSQLEISSKVKEHLVGRARVFHVNRLSFSEYIDFAGPVSNAEALDEILIYGAYPAVALQHDKVEKQLRLKDIYQSYVQKDLVDFLKLQNTDKFNNLLKTLAFQVGDLLNIQMLSKKLKTGRDEIEEYLAILEGTFICKRIYPFYKNYSKELTKMPKLYFLDQGIRNFILNDFKEPEMRYDKGKLFENFILTEELANDIHSFKNIKFWRTTNQTEVDFIIDEKGSLSAIETKWSDKKKPRAFNTLSQHYPDMHKKVVTRDDFI